MRIAFVYDRINKIGGAERILNVLHELWPSAPVYTAVYDSSRAFWAKNWSIRSSILQYIPFARSNHEFFSWATPFAFEQFCFDEYDVVISITSAEAKTIITKPETLHICYCLTPTRYLWSGYEDYVSQSGLGRWEFLAKSFLQLFLPKFRQWDKIAANRPDFYLSISKLVQERIQKYYKREVTDIIYPPVSLNTFVVPYGLGKKSFFLVVSRLVGYKRVDIAIESCNRLGLPLVVIGEGRDKQRLESIAGPTILFVDHYLTDEELVRYYQQCQALLFAGVEDFGLVAVEAQACGTPVIAYKNSGIAESIIDGKTGILFKEQTVDCLMQALNSFRSTDFNSDLCRKNAEKFSKEQFQKSFLKTINKLYKQYFNDRIRIK